VLEPSLLILDEPTEGLQPNFVYEIGDILMRLYREERVLHSREGPQRRERPDRAADGRRRAGALSV
jgi:hypothetical protein